MSEFFDITNRNTASCDFAGNATIVPNAPSPSAAKAAATSCLANLATTFTPTAPAMTSQGSGGSNKGGGAGSANSGDVKTAAIGFSLMSLGLVGGGVWTLLL